VAMLGLLKSVDLIVRENLKSEMRDEAVQIAEDRLAGFRAVPFASLLSGSPYAVELVPSALRGVSKNYTVSKTVAARGSNTVEMNVKVRWAYNNWSTSHEVVSVRSN
jgi:hypothetical protein